MASGIQAGDAVWTISGDISPLEQSLKQGETQVSSVTGRIAENSKAIGTAFTVAGAAVVGGFAVAGKAAMTFSGDLADVKTLGVTNIDELSDGAKDLSMDFGIDLSEAVGQVYQAISAGIPQDAAINVLEGAAKGAQAGVGSLTSALDLGTSTMNAWGMKGKDATETTANFEKIMGLAATAVKDGKTTIDEMGASIGGVAPVMAGAGIKVEEFYSAVAALTQTGMPASQAMNGLKAAVSNIMKPSQAAADLAEALGIEFDITALKTEGFTGWLESMKVAVDKAGEGGTAHADSLKAQITQLEAIQKPTADQKKALKALRDEYEIANLMAGDSVEVLATLFGSIEGVNAVMSLTGQQAGAYAASLEHMSMAQQNLNEMSAAFVEGNHELAWEKMKATMTVLAVEIGSALLPAFTSLIETVTPWIRSFAEFVSEHETLATVLTTAAAALGTLSLGLGTALLALSPLMIAFKAFSAVLGVGGLATSATAATTAIGTAGGSTGLLGAFAAIGTLSAPAIIAIAAVGFALASLGIALWETKSAYDQLEESETKLKAGTDQYIESLKAKGVAINDAMLATMTYEEQMRYTADAEKAHSDTLARAWFEYYAGRKESEQEFAQMRSMMLNEEVSAQEAAIAASAKLSDDLVQQIMSSDEEATKSLLDMLGIRAKAAKDTEETITTAQFQAALERNNMWMTETHALTASQTELAAQVNQTWADAISQMFTNLAQFVAGLPLDLLNFLGFGGGGTLTGNPSEHAEGGALSEGMNIVGERGPEAIIKHGSEMRVITAENTAAMGGGGVTINMNATIGSDMDIQRVAQRLGKMLEQRMTGVGASPAMTRI
jgi:hypothetical protein